MPRRLALLVATYHYQDPGLRQLASPGHDAEALAEVLRNPAIADFDVTILVNEPHHVVGDAIGEFYHHRRRDDLTLLYFTGHGLKDDEGRLHLAMTNTKRDRLLFTGLSAQQIDEAMDSCSSRQNVLVLDCCYSGAFPAGRIAKVDHQVHTLEKFHGKGRVVLTASDATQYSFEGNNIIGGGAQSVFTRFLVEGLTTGDADLDSDGDISLDELYSYVYDRVIEEMPQQRPKKQENVEGRIVIARNIHWSLPSYFRHALESPFARERLAALEGLAHLHRVGNDIVQAEVINETRRLIHDDSKAVSAAAKKLITTLNPEQARRQAEEQDEGQVVNPPVLLLPAVNDKTARNGQSELEALVDLSAESGAATEKQAPQQDQRVAKAPAQRKPDRWTALPLWLERVRRRYERQARRAAKGQDVAAMEVSEDFDLADSWGLGPINRRLIFLAASTISTALIIISLVAVLVIITGSGTSIPGPVPHVVGRPVASAEQTLNAAGFQTKRHPVESSPQDLDRVVAMNPAGRALPGVTIQLDVGVVGAPPDAVAVPDVVGTNIDQAQRNITAVRLTPQIQEVDSAAPKDQVLKQNPAGGTDVKAGTTVALTVSRGNQLQMPDLIGVTPSQALNTLRERGWAGALRQVSALGNEPNQDSRIISQDIPAGTEFARDQPITIRTL